MKQTFIQFLTEGPIRKTDPEMDDYYDDVEDIDSGAGDAPYAVGWSAQYLEWYGDGDPEEGRGRYKPKGDGGDPIAINVPSYEQAQRIAQQLEDKLAQKDMGEYGKDWGVYQGADVWIRPMSELDSYERDYIKRYAREIQDYSK